MAQQTRIAMDDQASLALMKFLSDLSKRLGVSKHVYVVGGAVRNFVLDPTGQKYPVKDIDVVIDSVATGKDSEWFAKEVARAIPAKTNITTNQYGVALMHIVGDWMLGEANLRGEDIEIANARTESYGQGGYTPDKVTPATIEQDVCRREFTFNCLLWRLHDLAEGPEKAEILDLSGCGLKDLQEGMMRCPSSPDKTFSDDPSRMIRAIKFLIKYGFKLSPEVKQSIEKNKAKLHNIPAAHLSGMLINTFLKEPTGKRALLEMQKLGLLDVIKEIAQKDKVFRDSLGNWVDREAKVDFIFDLMDLGLPSGKRLTFLDAHQMARVREVTVGLSHAASDQYVRVLNQPGKVLDTKTLMAEFNLKGAAVRQVQDYARRHLLDDPALASDGRRLTQRVRDDLKGGRTAKIFELNVGDPVLMGKYKNRLQIQGADTLVSWDDQDQNDITTASAQWQDAAGLMKPGASAQCTTNNTEKGNVQSRWATCLHLSLAPLMVAERSPQFGVTAAPTTTCSGGRAPWRGFADAIERVASRVVANTTMQRDTASAITISGSERVTRRPQSEPSRVRDGSTETDTAASMSRAGESSNIAMSWSNSSVGDSCARRPSTISMGTRSTTGSTTSNFGDGITPVDNGSQIKSVGPENYSVSTGIFSRTGKTFELNIGDPVLLGKYRNSPGRIEGFGETEKGDPTIVVRKKPKGDAGQGAKKEVQVFKVRYDEAQAKQDKEAATRVAHRYIQAVTHKIVLDTGGDGIEKNVPVNSLPLLFTQQFADAVAASGETETVVPVSLLKTARFTSQMKKWFSKADEAYAVFAWGQTEFEGIQDDPGDHYGGGVLGYVFRVGRQWYSWKAGEDKPQVQHNSDGGVRALRYASQKTAGLWTAPPAMVADVTEWVQAAVAADLMGYPKRDEAELKPYLRPGVPPLAGKRPLVRKFPMDLSGWSPASALPKKLPVEWKILRVVLGWATGSSLGSWDPKTKTLNIKVKFKQSLKALEDTVRHEMEHVAQTLMASLGSPGGLPPQRIQTPGHSQERMLYDESKTFAENYLLDDVEFYPQLTDMIQAAQKHLRGEDAESRQKAYLLSVIHGDVFVPMKVWREQAPGKWKKAIKEIYRVFPVLSGSGRLAAGKFKSKKEVPKADGKGTTTVYEYSDQQIANRHRDKADRIEKLRGKLHKLQAQVKKDLKSGDEATRHKALIVGLMNDTFERVGNEASAKDGHYGVTGWQAKHVTVKGSTATISYVGKSGVKQTKSTSDPALVAGLEKALEGKSGSDSVFEGTDASGINEYLKSFDITAKDIRGLHANREMQTKLKAIRSKGGTLPTDKKERQKKLKAEFKQALDEAAAEVGHEASTLRSQYLVPGIEDNFLRDGTVKERLNKQGSQPQHYRNICPKCGAVSQCRCLGPRVETTNLCPDCKGLTQPSRRLAARWFVEGTKTHAEKEDEDVRELHHKNPSKKPPRNDLRRHRMREDDPDIESFGADGDKDLSQNYKKRAQKSDAVVTLVGHQYRVLDIGLGWRVKDPQTGKKGTLWFQSAGGVTTTHAHAARVSLDMDFAAQSVTYPIREFSFETARGGWDKSRGTWWKGQEARVGSRWVRRLIAEEGKHKAGDVWQAESGVWVAMNPKGVTHTFGEDDKAKEQATAYAKGTADADGKADPAAEEAKKKQKAEQAKVDKARFKNETETLAASLEKDGILSEDMALQVMVMMESPEFYAAYQVEMRGLRKELADENVTVQMMQELGKDPFLHLDTSSPEAVARAFVQAKAQEHLLLDPSHLGGKPLSSEPMDSDALASRAEQAMKLYRRVTPEHRLKIAENAVQQLKGMTPDSPEAKELNSIIDGLHAASVLNDEPFDVKWANGKLLREPLNSKLKVLFKQMVKQNSAKMLFLEDPTQMYQAEGREVVRDAMGKLSDEDLVTMSKDAPWQSLADALGNSELSDDVKKYLRSLLLDMSVNSMTTVQGVAASIARQKKDPSNSSEVYDQVAKDLEDASREDMNAACDEFLKKCLDSGEEAAVCMKDGSQKIQQAQAQGIVDALSEMDEKPNPQDVPVAVMTAIAAGADPKLAEDKTLRPERPFAERKRDFLEGVTDPAERKRIEQMTPEEFSEMEKAVLAGSGGEEGP